MANGTQIHQWGFHRGNTQKWEFKHYDDGYYYIRSCNTSAVPMYYLTVQNDSTVEGAKIVLQSSISTGSQWKITSTSNGAYKITAKTGEANNRVLAVEWVTGDTTANGLDMEQKNYQDNDSYLDEWIICNSALLLAIDDSDGASRHTYFLKTKENLETEKNGFSSSTSTARYSSCSIPDMINYLKSSNIFVIHTHGIQTGFKISNSGTTFISIDDLNNVDLSNLTFVLLLTCKTGKNYNPSNITNNTPVNIVEKMVLCGAETVIGFNDLTYVDDCNLFAPAITSKLINEGLAVEDAIADINYGSYYEDMSAISVVAGNGNNKLR